MSLHEAIRPADVAEANALFKKARRTYETASFADAFRLFLQASVLGHAHATYMVGKCYLYGHGVMPDDHNAMRYFQQGIQLGVARASFILADHFRKLGMVQAAFRYYLVSAHGGDADAQMKVGEFYQNGIGTQPDIAKAIKWYALAGSNQIAEGGRRVKRLSRQL